MKKDIQFKILTKGIEVTTKVTKVRWMQANTQQKKDKAFVGGEKVKEKPESDGCSYVGKVVQWRP